MRDVAQPASHWRSPPSWPYHRCLPPGSPCSPPSSPLFPSCPLLSPGDYIAAQRSCIAVPLPFPTVSICVSNFSCSIFHSIVNRLAGPIEYYLNLFFQSLLCVSISIVLIPVHTYSSLATLLIKVLKALSSFSTIYYIRRLEHFYLRVQTQDLVEETPNHVRCSCRQA